MTTEILGSVTYLETPTVNGVAVMLADAVIGGSSSVLQTLTTVVPASTGTSTVTLNNTAPTIASGTQIWTQAITPSATTSRVALRGALTIAHGTAARTVIAMVFRGTTCISVVGQYCATANTLNSIPISIVDQPASIAAQTYTIRIAGSAAGTWYVQQTATAYFAGLLATSDILTQEIA
jgi:hypothetical protein